MREGGWTLVEYYDEERVELYELGPDLSETRNVAEQEPARVAKMRAALAAWRKSVNAQENKPNPNFDPAKFRELYIDVDASQFEPAKANQADWEKMWQWRKQMNAVASGAGKGN